MVSQELKVKEKQEQLEEQGEKTQMARFFVPETDIRESADTLYVTMDMPGVGKDSVEVHLDKNTLTVTGKIDVDLLTNLKPLYTEYNVGNYSRSFTVSSQIEKEGIAATIDNGVLSIILPKIKESTARQITVN